MIWDRGEWEEYLTNVYGDHYNAIGEELICSQTNPRYNTLRLNEIYILRDIESSEDDELLYFVVSLKGSNLVVRYNCCYFLPRTFENKPINGIPFDSFKCDNCEIIYLKRKLMMVRIGDERKSYCMSCYNMLKVDRCDFCGEVKHNVIYIKDLRQRVCNTCSTINIKTIHCKVCNKNRLVNKEYKEQICLKCKDLDFSRLESIFNRKKGETYYENRIKDIFWYVNTLKTKERTFGLEFEVSAKEARIKAVIGIKKDLLKIKVDDTHTLLDFLIMKYDGSLDRNGIEFNTIVLGGEQSKEYLKQIVEVLKKYCYVNMKCGLHLHIGIKDFKEQELARLYYFYNRFQRLFKLYVNEKRLSNRYCLSLPKRKKWELLQGQIIPRDRYRAVNFQAFHEFGTIELRILEGTLDIIKILKWVELHIKIIESVKKDTTLLLKDWKMPNKAKHILGSKLYTELKELQKKYNETHLKEEQKINKDMILINFLFKED